MKWRVAILVGLACCIGRSACGSEVSFSQQTRLRFASVEEGRASLLQRDVFIKSLSPFDRQSRMETGKDVSEQEFLGFVRQQVVAWSEADVKKLAPILARIAEKLAPLKLPFPPTILLVQTTGKEEGRAAYCRGHAVVLPQTIVKQPAKSLQRLLTHELFHILSSHTPKLRQRLYAILGFQPCNEIELPASWRARKITNPDAPLVNHFAEVRHQDRSVAVAPILLSSTERYDARRGGQFFRYMLFRLLEIHRQGNRWVVAERNGEPILLNPDDVPAYREKLGGNTGYIIHPEETLAEDFVLLVNHEEDVRSPQILNEMKRVLSEWQD
jgi:hypothetical protein